KAVGVEPAHVHRLGASPDRRPADHPARADELQLPVRHLRLGVLADEALNGDQVARLFEGLANGGLPPGPPWGQVPSWQRPDAEVLPLVQQDGVLRIEDDHRYRVGTIHVTSSDEMGRNVDVLLEHKGTLPLSSPPCQSSSGKGYSLPRTRSSAQQP